MRWRSVDFCIMGKCVRAGSLEVLAATVDESVNDGGTRYD
jgi:hypothetical protein